MLRYTPKYAAFLSLFVPFVLFAPVDARAAGLVELFAKIGPSVGALYAQDEKGDLNFLCSATAVGRYKGDTVVLTAYHCMKKGVGYLINFGDNNLRPLRVWKVPHYEVDETKYPRRFNEPETDAALMLVEGQDLPIVPLAESSDLEPGRRIAMLGFPLGVTKLSYQGSIAGRFNRVGTDMYNYLLLQIFGAPGSSGSAVIDADTGKVVAILVAAKQSRVGLPVIFATPIEYLAHLLPVLPEQAKEVGATPSEAGDGGPDPR